MRVLMIPVVMVLLVRATPRMCFWAALVYTLAVITDALDGWLARRQGLNSLLGKFLDPLADKLIVMAILIVLVDMDRAPAWLVILIIARELSIGTLRSIAVGQGMVIAAGRGGKDKTAIQMVALLLLVLHYPYYLYFGLFTIRVDLHQAGMMLLYVSVFFALASALQYVQAFLAYRTSKVD
jgi:CDP-diacylglycerol--glycerol-3-phosphate 3-phosphatidyltransferase